VFDEALSEVERRTWRVFKAVTTNFLGNFKAESLIEKLLNAYKVMGCKMSLRIHFLNSHLDFVPTNFGAVIDEHGECFLQEISMMEK
jgi:hypothetical protein